MPFKPLVDGMLDLRCEEAYVQSAIEPRCGLFPLYDRLYVCLDGVSFPHADATLDMAANHIAGIAWWLAGETA